MSENFTTGSVEDFDFGYSTENYDAGCEWTELPNDPDYAPCGDEYNHHDSDIFGAHSER
jgi:hypothetical protein